MRDENEDKLILRPVAQKVLLLLVGGLTLGLTTSPDRYFRVLETIKKDWKEINRRALYRAIRKLYKSRLIYGKDNLDGTTTLTLTNKGKKTALTYQIDNIKIPPMKKWDGQWRIVLFDIPEEFKKKRDAISRILKQMGFYKFQKSVFAHPFDCSNEVDFVIEFFLLRPYVRFILAHKLDNELHLKKYFGLK